MRIIISHTVAKVLVVAIRPSPVFVAQIVN
jgi:hypothetical protein